MRFFWTHFYFMVKSIFIWLEKSQLFVDLKLICFIHLAKILKNQAAWVAKEIFFIKAPSPLDFVTTLELSQAS